MGALLLNWIHKSRSFYVIVVASAPYDGEDEQFCHWKNEESKMSDLPSIWIRRLVHLQRTEEKELAFDVPYVPNVALAMNLYGFVPKSNMWHTNN